MSDAGLKNLQFLTALETLDLGFTKVTGSDLKDLEPLSALKRSISAILL